MRKGLIGVLLIPPLLLAALWFTLPWSAQYLLQQWLQEQGFDQPRLVIQRPSWQYLRIDHLSVSQRSDGRRLILEADNIELRFSPLDLLQGQLHELRIEQARLQIDADASIRGRFQQLEQQIDTLLLTPFNPTQLFQYAPSQRLVIAQLELIYTAPEQPVWSARGNIDLEPTLLQSRMQLLRASEALGYLDLTLDPALNLGLSLNHDNHYLLRSAHQLTFPEQDWQLRSDLLLNATYLTDWLQRLQLPIVLPVTALDGQVRLNTRLRIPSLMPTHLPEWLNQVEVQLNNQLELATGPGDGVDSSQVKLTLAAQLENGDFSLSVAQGSTVTLTGLKQPDLQLAKVSAQLTAPLQLSGHWQHPDRWQHTPLALQVTPNGLQTPLPVAIALQPVTLAIPAGALLRQQYPLTLQLPDIRLQPDRQPPLNLAVQADMQLDWQHQRISTRARLDSTQLPLTATLDGHFDRRLHGQLQFTLAPTHVAPLQQALNPWLPSTLRPLVLKQGTLSASGRVEFKPKQWTLKATPLLHDIDFIWDEHTQVTGMNLRQQLTVDASGRFHNEGLLEVDHTDSGIRIFGPRVDFDLDMPSQGPPRLSLSTFSLSALDGIIAVPALSFNPLQPVIDTRIAVAALELDKILSLYPQEGLYGSGVLGGALPVQINGDQLRISGGQLVSQGEGGVIRYQATPEISLMAQQNPGIQLALEALTDFRFNLLDLTLDYAPDGEAVIQARLKGHNPGWQQGRPVDLNLNIEENLLDLLRTLRLTDRVTDAIDRRFRR
ncbi:dicarboxylate transport [Marinobacterium halophilum]|uniref:Dicarboxylate transport n=1 Tax=Marinobacterium halophilum TaxID=267374 RepID=A0A2P8F216_9GAMM|nr:YdbH domain-containing protein [Marinobacterium halophilum]PSL15757.1 dicarboxylate transport [Marinobacterium halophilum]